MELLNLKRVRSLLAEVVTAHGEDTMRVTCRYVREDGTPDCIVGQVLAKVGLDLEILVEKGVNTSALSSDLVRDVILQGGVALTQVAADYLVTAQQVQDGRAWLDEPDADGSTTAKSSWGNALARAEARFAHHTEGGA